MKYIFYTLLAANLAYFGFSVWIDTGSEPVTMRQGSASVPENTATIKLVSESNERSDRDLEIQEVLENPLAMIEAEETLKHCEGLGPFSDMGSAQIVTERLIALGAPVTLRAVDELTGDFDYRVVIPPLSSLQEAFRKLRELNSQGIESFVITAGSDAQGISLGVHSDESDAVESQADLRTDGYNAEIREIARVDRKYWIYGAAGWRFGSAISGLNAEFPGLDVNKIACLN